jgi:hypothetical protein
MGRHLIPLVGHWYSHLHRGDRFQVVALDEQGGTVEIQDFDGDIDEMAVEEWFQLELEEAEPPDDWRGPVDDGNWHSLAYDDLDAEQATSSLFNDQSSSWNETAWRYDEPVDQVGPLRKPALHRARSKGRHRHH